MKYLLSRKKGSNDSITNGNANAVEIKYKLLKGKRPPRLAKKVRSKASSITKKLGGGKVDV